MLQFGPWRVHRRSRRIATHSQQDQAPICYLQAERDDASCSLRLTPAARCDACFSAVLLTRQLLLRGPRVGRTFHMRRHRSWHRETEP